jgi:hypothetical protein
MRGKPVAPTRKAVKTVDEAIEIAKSCSSLWELIRCQNHLNEWGYRTTVDPMSVANVEGQLRGLHLFLCNLSHQIANEKTFEMVQYGKTFKLTAEKL